MRLNLPRTRALGHVNAFRKLQADNRAALASPVQALVELRRQSTGRVAVN